MNKFFIGLVVLAVSHVSFAVENKEETVGNWYLETTTNEVTSQVERYAELEAVNDEESALSIRCEGSEFDFYFNIGDFFSKKDEQSLVVIRDQDKAEVVEWLAAESWDAVFAENPHTFIKSLLGKKTLSVGYTTSESQARTANFNLEGIEEVYRKLAEVCPEK